MKRLKIGKISWVIILTSLFHTVAANTLPPDLNKRLQAFQTAIEKEPREEASAQPRPCDSEREDPAPYLLSQLRLVVGRGDLNEIDRLIGEIASVYRSDSIRKLAEKLRTDLHLEIEKKEATAVARLRAVIEEASKTVRSATKPVDLDPTLQNLSLGDSVDPGRFGPKEYAERSKVQAARQFVSYWQDYLASREWADTRTAQQKLEAASNLKVELLPRSEILTRIGELKKRKGVTPAEEISEIMGKTKSLDAIPAAIDTLFALERDQEGLTGWPGHTVVFLRSELAAISGAYQEYKKGFPTTFSIKRLGNQPNNDDPVRLTQSLRLEFLFLVLPRVLGVKENQRPNRDEMMQSYLDRILAEATETLDARLLLRVREFQNAISGERQLDLTALQPLLAAQNQDAAGQFGPAVASYQTALKSGGDLVPAEPVGARLEAIKAAHPAEYSQGMEQFLKNPPSFSYRSSSSPSTIAIPGATTR